MRLRSRGYWLETIQEFKDEEWRDEYQFSDIPPAKAPQFLSRESRSARLAAYLVLHRGYSVQFADDGVTYLLKKDIDEMFLYELFDSQPPKLEWKHEGADMTTALFEIDGREYRIFIYDGGFDDLSVKQVDFSHNGSTEATNFGSSQFKVLGTVVNAAVGYLAGRNVDLVYFSAKNIEEAFSARANVYSRLMRTLSAKYDLVAREITYEDEQVYLLAKDKNILDTAVDYLTV